MVDVDAGDHSAVGVDDIGRIQPPTQPHLQNGHIQQRMAHQPQYGEGRELKIGQRNIIAVERARTLNGLEVRQQIGGCHHITRDAAALLKMHQMGRRVYARAITRLLGHGFDHGAGGALAIGTRHRDDGTVKTQAHAASHFAHPVQVHVDIVGMQALAMGKPAFQCVNLLLHAAWDCRRPCAWRMMAP